MFTDYSPRVYNLARRMLNSDADAEDVTQDVLLQVVRKLNTFRGDSSFATWIHRVTTNAALLHHRKKALRKERVGAAECCATHVSPTRRESAAPDAETPSASRRNALASPISDDENNGAPHPSTAVTAIDSHLSVPASAKRITRSGIRPLVVGK